MKFLCVKCDDAMQLADTVANKDEGSLSVCFRCPTCGQETAMLTNRSETQMVTSLGIKIGGKGAGDFDDGQPKCPFTSVARESLEKSVASSDVVWSSAASERLDKVPSFIRPMAKDSIESFAKERGYQEITETVLTEAKEIFGIG